MDQIMVTISEQALYFRSIMVVDIINMNMVLVEPVQIPIIMIQMAMD